MLLIVLLKCKLSHICINKRKANKNNGLQEKESSITFL